MRGPLAEANVYRFFSKEFDVNCGLYYYGFRYYEPNLQRWINRDPLGEAGGINLYGFVGNNPISYGDPYGLKWVLFDGEAWGQFSDDVGLTAIPRWLRKTFIGNPCPNKDLQQFSNLALRAQEGVGVSTFEGPGCRTITGSELILSVALAPLDGVVTAATLPLGGGGSQIFRHGARGGLAGRTAALSRSSISPNAGVLFSKTGGVPMDPALFKRIQDAFQRKGGVMQSDANMTRLLNNLGAEGATTDATTILLKQNPSRSAVFEELIHSAQLRRGMADRNLMEIEAAEKLIRFRRQFGIPNSETRATIQNLRKERAIRYGAGK